MGHGMGHSMRPEVGAGGGVPDGGVAGGAALVAKDLADQRVVAVEEELDAPGGGGAVPADHPNALPQQAGQLLLPAPPALPEERLEVLVRVSRLEHPDEVGLAGDLEHHLRALACALSRANS